MPLIIHKPVFKTDISFDVAEQTSVEKSTIVHCVFNEPWGLIRIWPTTLLSQNCGGYKKLLHAYNIAAHPHWKYVEYNHVFTLVFEGLDSACTQFDLVEDIPEPGGFYISNIRRNETDVYFLDLY